MKQQIIKRKDFILRPYTVKDRDALVENLNNKKVSRYLSRVLYPYNKKNAREWLAKILKEKRKITPKFLSFAIEIDEKLAGGISFKQMMIGHKAELGYWLGEKYWGRGIMTKVVKEITKYGFKNLKLRRIYSYVPLPNIASKRVLEKAGFELEGILKKHSKKESKIYDAYFLAKVK
ncbi:MAG: GNAT family N-acetyltransferase [Patescibacteria group bacterium]